MCFADKMKVWHRDICCVAVEAVWGSLRLRITQTKQLSPSCFGLKWRGPKLLGAESKHASGKFPRFVSCANQHERLWAQHGLRCSRTVRYNKTETAAAFCTLELSSSLLLLPSDPHPLYHSHLSTLLVFVYLPLFLVLPYSEGLSAVGDLSCSSARASKSFAFLGPSTDDSPVPHSHVRYPGKLLRSGYWILI